LIVHTNPESFNEALIYEMPMMETMVVEGRGGGREGGRGWCEKWWGLEG